MPTTFMVAGKEYTPQSYAREHLGFQREDYVSLGNHPTERAGWRDEGGGVNRNEVYNTSADVMKAAVRTAIDQGRKVYISAPVGEEGAMFVVPAGKGQAQAAYFPEKANGVMSIKAFDYASLGPHEVLDKAAIQSAGLHENNHAMTVVGYELGPDGAVRKWKVENSWGPEAADHGIQHMYDDFFTQLVNNAVVPQSALPEALRAQVQKEHAIFRQEWAPPGVRQAER